MSTRTIRSLLCLCAALLLSAVSFYGEAGETAKNPTIAITKEAKITANIENKPLHEALRMMASKNLFEIKGAVPAGEPVTVRLSNATLDEALKKLMRGYNYVLVSQGTSRKPSLMVMGKIQADRSAPRATPAQPARPARADQVLIPGTYYVPPSLLPPTPSPSRAAPAGRKTQERRPPTQGNDPKEAAGQQQGEPQAPKPPESPGTENQPQQDQQQQQSGEQQQQQSTNQLQTQPVQSSGISARDLLGRSHSSL
jgi:hypothetical protein